MKHFRTRVVIAASSVDKVDFISVSPEQYAKSARQRHENSHIRAKLKLSGRVGVSMRKRRGNSREIFEPDIATVRLQLNVARP